MSLTESSDALASAEKARKKTAHENRFVLGHHLAKVLEKWVFSLVGAPGLEPGTR
jgi:hypothetical protein